MSIESLFQRVACCICLFGVLGFAQDRSPQSVTRTGGESTTGTFSGRITGSDRDGATITLKNTATGEASTAVTDSTGAFSISNLKPGSYRATVQLKSGLQLGETAVEISPSSQSTQINVDFNAVSAAALSGKLELDGTSPTVQTGSAEVSRSYDSQFVRSLPLLDRQNQELIGLMPGITPPVPAADRINDPQRTRSFNVNGQPAYVNLYNQDGVYNNESFSGRPLRTAPNEAVQALEVRTSNYNAEYGVSAGSWASTVTRPGTNAIHGSIFEFNTNSFLRAGRTLDFTETAPKFNVNQFGGTAGGAIVPDKVFWFLSYEGFLQRGRQEAVATVPTIGLGSGNFDQMSGTTIYNPFSGNSAGGNRTVYPGNTIPTSQLNQSSQQILALLPQANRPGYSNNLVGSIPLLDDNHRADGKIDHRFSEHSTGFFRYGYTQSSVNQGSLLGLAGSPLNSEFRAMNGVASVTHIFKTNLLAEFRVGYNRYRNQISPWGDFSSLNGAFTGFPNGVPSVNIAGFSPIGLPANVPRKEIDNVYDGATNWVFRTGMHSLKFGIGARSLQSNGFSNPFFSSYGSFVFGPGATLGTAAAAAGMSPAALQANALAGFLAGAPSQAGVANFIGTPSYRQMQSFGYLSDSVNLFQKVYLELGVRYDIFSPVEAAQPGGAVTFDPSSRTVTPLGVDGVGMRSTRTDLNNVAPRVGLAFRPVNRLVFRAGYGIHYFPMPFSLVAFNPAVAGAQAGLAGGLGTTAFAVPAVGSSSNLPYLTGSRDLKTPYLQTFSGMVQVDAGSGFLLDIGYVGSLGRQLPYSIGQTGLPGTGVAGLPAGVSALTSERGTALTSNYNSLQVNLTKKFAAGLSLAAAYTYGKALDYGSNLADPYTRYGNYGPADWDRTHILAVSHDWRLPFGVRSKYFRNGWAARMLGDWELTGILRWSTGTPFNVTADPLACACLGVSSVPAAYTGMGSSINGSASFDPNMFSSPSAGTFGTLRRNSFRGPDLFVYNAALFRNFAITENIKFELRGEAYNVTNTSNYLNPVADMMSPGFGTSMGSMGGLAGRQFQVGGRFLF